MRVLRNSPNRHLALKGAARSAGVKGFRSWTGQRQASLVRLSSDRPPPGGLRLGPRLTAAVTPPAASFSRPLFSADLNHGACESEVKSRNRSRLLHGVEAGVGEKPARID